MTLTKQQQLTGKEGKKKKFTTKTLVYNIAWDGLCLHPPHAPGNSKKTAGQMSEVSAT